MIPAVISWIAIFLIIVPGRSFNPTSYYLKTIGKEKTRERLEEVYSEEFTAFKIQESLNEMKLRGQKSKESEGFWYNVKLFNKEFALVVLAFLTLGVCNPSIYYNFSVLIGAKDYTNPSRVHKAKVWSTASSIIELTTYLLLAVFKLNKKRKRSLLLACSSFLVGTILITVGYSTKNIKIARVCGVFMGMGVPLVYSSIFLMMHDLLPKYLLFFGCMIEQTCNMVYAFLYPLLLTVNTTYKQWATIFGL